MSKTRKQQLERFTLSDMEAINRLSGIFILETMDGVLHYFTGLRHVRVQAMGKFKTFDELTENYKKLCEKDRITLVRHDKDIIIETDQIKAIYGQSLYSNEMEIIWTIETEYYIKHAEFFIEMYNAKGLR